MTWSNEAGQAIHHPHFKGANTMTVHQLKSAALPWCEIQTAVVQAAGAMTEDVIPLSDVLAAARSHCGALTELSDVDAIAVVELTLAHIPMEPGIVGELQIAHHRLGVDATTAELFAMVERVLGRYPRLRDAQAKLIVTEFADVLKRDSALHFEHAADLRAGLAKRVALGDPAPMRPA